MDQVDRLMVDLALPTVDPEHRLVEVVTVHGHR